MSVTLPALCWRAILVRHRVQAAGHQGQSVGGAHDGEVACNDIRAAHTSHVAKHLQMGCEAADGSSRNETTQQCSAVNKACTIEISRPPGAAMRLVAEDNTWLWHGRFSMYALSSRTCLLKACPKVVCHSHQVLHNFGVAILAKPQELLA